jgi:hypothetical protein
MSDTRRAGPEKSDKITRMCIVHVFRSLTDAIDPEENPYKSKYAARELLKIWRKKLDDGEVR